ncbi:S8 family serine peptidase [Amycolatopsis sp. cmx-4-68]|uniref:S8 family serine peptidase n=1 Tax=Amycolatopsis sp. cmx-4-68 TaxID=2790938 RepID=UPI00397E279C
MNRPITALIAVTVISAALTSPQAAAADRPSVTPSRITLVTGDQVLLGGTDVRVLPARRDRPVPFQQYTRHGDAYVLPGDAAGLVRAGRLDEQLFNVTGLLRQGYDDARTPHVPLLVRQTGPAVAARTGVAARPAALGYTALDAPKADAAGFWNRLTAEPATLAAGTTKVWLNAKVHASLDRSVPQIGAPAAWQSGLTGRGVGVAVLDTGIDAGHPDLAGRVTTSKDFTGKGSVEDGAGHGTHVASTIAGSGAASGGKYKGVAPDATLAVGKVLDDSGDGTFDEVLAGMQWAVTEAHARVVNMSLGGGPSDGTDPVSEAVNTLTRQYGTLFVVAAGNFGQDESVATPAAADAALAVASVSKQDVLSPFSSRGPRLGDGAAKPDVAAPGESITAARPAGIPPAGEPVGDGYQTLSGTSMASPHVAGSAAILAQQHPDWPADRLKAALTSTATPVEAAPAAVGTGRVDVARATTTAVTATGSASVFLPWPNHGATGKATVTWYNSGATPVTLALGSSVEGVTFPATVTVPAGGSTPVELTFAARDGHPGTFSGILTARGDGVSTRTVLSFRQEDAMYDLTVGLVDRDGRPWTPTGYPPVSIVDLDTGALTQGEPGTFRLPRGRYVVNSVIETPRRGQEPSYSFLTHPELALDHDVTQILDARDGRPVSLEPDNPAARGGTQSIERLSRITACACVFDNGFDLDPRFQEAFAATVPGTSSATFAFSQNRRATEPDLELTADDGQPFAVRGVWLASAAPAGRSTLPVAFGDAGTPEDLAKIDAHGKLVVVRLPVGIAVDEAYRRLADVERAGAKLGMVDLSGDGTATTVLGGSLPELTLPTIWSGQSVTARRFTELAKTGAASATVVSRPSPNFRYELADGVEKHVTAPRVRRPKTRDLAEVRTGYHDNAPGEVRYVAGHEFFGRMVGYGYTEPVAAQQERAEYYSPGQWETVWTAGRRGELTEDLDLAAGRKYGLTWNKAVGGPSLRGLTVTHSGEAPRPWAWRKDGLFDLWLPMFGDAAGRPRTPDSGAGDTGSVSLSKDGVAIPVPPSGEPTQATIPVPDADGAYRLTADVHRHADWWPLWTDVTAEWTFRSSSAADGRALPLLTARFDPAVDLHNSTPGGRVFTFPAYVERQGGGIGSKLAVETSSDDGRSWQSVPVIRTGDHWTVVVRNPAGGFVSLRASAADDRGNTVRQTVIRAYAVG